MRMWKGEISQEAGQSPLANIADETNNAAAASDSQRAKKSDTTTDVASTKTMRCKVTKKRSDVAGREEEEPRNECFVAHTYYIQTGEQSGCLNEGGRKRGAKTRDGERERGRGVPS